MKVAIVHDYIAKVGGAQNVLRTLHEIYPGAPVYTLLYDKDATRGEFDDWNIIPSSLQRKPKFIRKRPKLLLRSFPRAIEEFDLTEFDLVISSSNSFAHGIITRPNTLHLCYCYSPMRYAWDWHAEYLVENHLSQGLLSIIIQKWLSGIRQWDFLASKRVDSWVAISKTVQNRIKKYYRADAVVIYPPADINDYLEGEIKPGDYYLVISHLTPYKKIDLAVEAFRQNGKKLVVVGEGPDRARLETLAQGKNNIEFTGYLSREQAKELLLGCKAFIFPGEEDFGLTPVEAMACGKPVVAFAKGGVCETVIEGRTGTFFADSSPESLNEAIQHFEDNFGNFKADECRKRAKTFSKKLFVKEFKRLVEGEYEKFQR